MDLSQHMVVELGLSTPTVELQMPTGKQIKDTVRTNKVMVGTGKLSETFLILRKLVE